MQRIIKLHFVENFSEGDKDGQLEAMKNVFRLVGPDQADVIFCASIVKVQQAMSLKRTYQKPMVAYCWDYYKWVHDGNNGNFDWKLYRQFLKECDLVLVPSDGQKKRLKELLNIDSVVCECSTTFYDHETKDGRYVLDPVRDYPEENLGWVEKACEELGIPYVHTEHRYSQEEFRKLVSECTFMTCAYREASTGGLSLLEGLYNGKVSLVSNSPYMGARNYLKDKGYYFQYDDFEDLKKKIKELWDDYHVVSLKEAQKHCRDYTHEAFAGRLYKNILCVLNQNY